MLFNREVVEILKNIKRFVCKRNLKIFVNLRENFVNVYLKNFEIFLQYNNNLFKINIVQIKWFEN